MTIFTPEITLTSLLKPCILQLVTEFEDKKGGSGMNEVIRFLNENLVQCFATVGLDGKPKVRPFQYMHEHEGKLYFCTSNQKRFLAS